MSQDQTDISSVCNIIEHLARYKLVRALANKKPADPFRESFEAQIISRSGKIFNPECVVEMEQDEEVKFTFELKVKNKGNKDLYVYLYDLGPCWQVQDIYRGSCEVIPLQNSNLGFTGIFRKRLRIMVPPEMREKGHRQCKDIIKVFITSKPTSFDLLELPKIGSSKLAKRNSSTTGRTGREDSDTPEEWVALNFPIHTSLK